MKKILSELKSGICEIIYMDEHSIEVVISVTLSDNHLPDNNDDGTPISTHTKNSITLFNLVAEEWQTIQLDSIINVEQLTGEGAVNNKKKLTASAEYIESLFGGNSGGIDDSDDDLDSMEHPEL